MDTKQLQKIVEGALLAAGRPLSVDHLLGLFGLEDVQPTRDEIRAALEDIGTDCADKGFELKQVASGYRFQVRQELSPWISRLWEERPQKYSRALLETLSIIAYRQPVSYTHLFVFSHLTRIEATFVKAKVAKYPKGTPTIAPVTQPLFSKGFPASLIKCEAAELASLKQSSPNASHFIAILGCSKVAFAARPDLRVIAPMARWSKGSRQSSIGGKTSFKFGTNNATLKQLNKLPNLRRQLGRTPN